jgi:hypothetical protein
MKTVTARWAARHGVPAGATVVSPYTGRVREIIAARQVGNKVELLREGGGMFVVDAGHPLQVVKR